MTSERQLQPLTSEYASFEKMRQNHSLYVDKTAWLHRLITDTQHKSFFISRPRRFGKSLMLSTLEAIFQGRRELFKGLDIDHTDYDWQVHPVVHLDASEWDYESSQQLNQCLCDQVLKLGQQHGVAPEGKGLKMLFGSFIERLHQKAGQTVVILIDEYDKPVLDNLGNLDRALAVKTVLRSFYSTVKSKADHIRFAMITGVSQFTKVGFFSDLNTVTSLTMHEDYADMLGYTQQELEDNFSDHIDDVAARKGCTRQQLLDDLKTWYNGYQFSQRPVKVYTPTSIAKFFISHGQFDNYWFQAGTPSFLFPATRDLRMDFFDRLEDPVPQSTFETFDLENLLPMGFLFQAGYLTIKKTAPLPNGDSMYFLNFPNREVEDSFKDHLLRRFTTHSQDDHDLCNMNLRNAFREGDAKNAIENLKTIYAHLPYDEHIPRESFYRAIFCAVMAALRFHVEAEIHTEQGRMDAAVFTEKWVHVIEFKLDQSAQAAMDQIHQRGYYRKYLGGSRRIMLLAVNVNTQNHNIDDWKAEEVPSATKPISP